MSRAAVTLAGWAIRDAAGTADFTSARDLFEEYAASLGVDLGFQGFAAELASLPGDYAPPRGCLLLLRPSESGPAAIDGDAAEAGARREAGCVALRPIGTTGAAELKRLYLRPQARGLGLGRDLALAAIERARSIGYREIRLDTLATMTSAQRLYRALGFRLCPAYYRNPLPGVVWLALDLVRSAPTANPPSASR